MQGDDAYKNNWGTKLTKSRNILGGLNDPHDIPALRRIDYSVFLTPTLILRQLFVEN